MFYGNQQTGEFTARFTMKDLPQGVAAAIDTLEVGEISQSFRMLNNSNQMVCAIVKLKNRIPAHHATMTEDYQVMEAVVLNDRREKFLNEWIREKQRSTYVRINKDWRNQKFQYPGWIK